MESVTEYLMARPGQAVFTTPPPREGEWIVIELLDDSDEPVAGERYAVTLPDGTVREGTLDDRGRATIEGIPEAGTCQVTFPDLDEAAWDAV
jgi:hypothetical protein